MTLQTLLTDYFNEHGPTQLPSGLSDYILTNEQLITMIDDIKQCDEFRGCEIELITELQKNKLNRVQTGIDEDSGMPMYAMVMDAVASDGDLIVTSKLSKDMVFAPTVKIWSISLSPQVYDVNDLYDGDPDTVLTAPTMLNEKHNTPIRRVVLSYSPELLQSKIMQELTNVIKSMDEEHTVKEFAIDPDNINDAMAEAESQITHIDKNDVDRLSKEIEDARLTELTNMVKDALVNPNRYMIPARRYILLRLTQQSILDNNGTDSSDQITVVLN